MKSRQAIPIPIEIKFNRSDFATAAQMVKYVGSGLRRKLKKLNYNFKKDQIITIDTINSAKYILMRES